MSLSEDRNIMQGEEDFILKKIREDLIITVRDLTIAVNNCGTKYISKTSVRRASQKGKGK